MISSKYAALFMMVASVWSLQNIVFKLAMEHVPPFLLLGLRNGISGPALFLLILALGIGRGLRRRLRYLAPMVLLYSIDEVFWISGLNLVTAGESAILFHTYPLMVVVASSVVVGESITLGKVLGMVVGFIGATLFFIQKFYEFSFNLLGYTFTLIAALGWALHLIFARRWSSRIEPRLLAATNLTVTSFLLLGFSFWNEGVHPAAALRTEVLLPLAFTTVGNILALVAWLELAKRWQPTRMATYAFLIPLMTVAFSWVLLNQTLAPIPMVGMLMIFSGIVLVNPPRFAQRQNRSTQT